MFGFPAVSREENFHFKNNFLRSVIYQIKFPINPLILENSQKISSILINRFPNKQDIVQNKVEFKIENKTQVLQNLEVKSKGMNFLTKDGNKGLIISNEEITYTFNGNVYVNFKQLFEEIQFEINEISDICNIKSLNRIGIRKINLLDFSVDGKINAVDTLGLIFNQSLVSNFLSFPAKYDIERSLSNINLTKGDQRLNLSYGLLSKDGNRNLKAILDIDLFSVNQDLPFEQLEEHSNVLNKEIFNIFCWALQDETKNQLNHGA